MSRSVRTEDVLDLMESLLQAQLDTIQELRRVRTAENDTGFLGRKPTRQRHCHGDMACEVLVDAGEPLHLSEVTKGVRETYGVVLTRESLASAELRDVFDNIKVSHLGAI